MGDLRNDVELLDRDLVDLVHHVQAWAVLAGALDCVDDVIDRRVATDPYLCVGDPIFFEHLSDSLLVAVFEAVPWRTAQCKTTFVLLLEMDFRWLLVQSDAKALQLVLDL